MTQDPAANSDPPPGTSDQSPGTGVQSPPGTSHEPPATSPSREPPATSPSHEPPASSPSRVVERVVATLEVLLCSGFPTQLALGGTFIALGYRPQQGDGGLSIGYVVGVSLIDAALVIALVVLFLTAHGERFRDVVVGNRPIVREAMAGIPLVVPTFALAVAVLLAIQLVVPQLHDVEKNPLQDLLVSPRNAWLFALVVLVAGGIREEIQRAFILHRFEQWLGGARAGLLVTSVAFGAGHLIQGADAAVATGVLGAFWGFIYLRRGSAIAPMVSHAAFDLLQIVQFVVLHR